MVPTAVSSWRDFTQSFGGFETKYPPSPLHLAVFSYFSAGGTSAVVVRMTTSTAAPVASSLVLDDQGTSVQPTLNITAASPGQWGNDLYIDITPGSLSQSAQSGQPQGQVLSFNIIVKYQGTQPANVVETWQNVSMNPTSSQAGLNNYAPSVINSSFNGSKYIRVTAAPGNTNNPPQNNPAAVSNQPLLGGLDGPGSPPAPPPTPNFNDYLLACQLLDQFPDQQFVLNLCGTYDTPSQNIIGNLVQQYVEPRGNIFLVADPPPGYGFDQVKSWAQALTFRSSVAAVYYPQVIVADPYSPQLGQTRIVPPGGFVVGTYIATDTSRGVAKAPAGLTTSLGGVYGVEPTGILTNDQQGTLNQINVNCLIPIPGYGVVVWGARTMSEYVVTQYVPVSRTLIYLSTEFVSLTRFAVFEPNDYVLWGSITSVLNQFLSGFWQSGGLQGLTAGDAYYVLCDSSINTVQSIQAGIVNVEVGVALQYPAEFVVIKIGQWAGGQSVSVST